MSTDVESIIENVESAHRVTRKWDEYPLDTEDLHTKVISDFQNLANVSNYNSRVRLLDLWSAVYHDRKRNAEADLGTDVYNGYLKQRLNRLNVIRDGCKRIMNMVVKAQPRPMYLSTGGSVREQRAGEDATDYMAAVFKKLGINKKTARMCLDALVWGTGMLRVRGREGDGSLPVAERVYPHDVLVDIREAMYDEPRHEFIQHLIPRTKLKAWVRGVAKNYKGASEEELLKIVEMADDKPFTDIYYRHTEYRWSDMVRVIEALALPSMEGAGDGKKVFVVSSGVLWGGEWERMDDGIVKLIWSQDLENMFFGIGVAEEGVGLFQAIDDIMEKIEECHELMTSQVWCESGSEVKKEKMSNLPWAYYTYTGTKPDFMTPIVVSPDTYQYGAELYEKFYAMLGVPSNEQDRIKSGQSGIAIQLEEDKKSGNLTLFSEDYEEARMTISDYLLRELSEMSPPKLAYTDKQKGVARMVDFDLVRENIDSLQSTIYPVSQMSNNPQGKIDQTERLLAMQVIDAEGAAEVMNWPDLKAATSAIGAPRKLVDLYIDAALMGEAPGPNVDLPEPYMRSRANDRLAEAELKGATEDDLEGLRAWISLQDAAYKERMAQTAPPPLPGVMPGVGAGLETAGEPLAGGGIEAIPPGAVPPGGMPLQ
jgi:hypothetical protein